MAFRHCTEKHFKAVEDYPFFGQYYEDAWPIERYLRKHLGYTTWAHRHSKRARGLAHHETRRAQDNVAAIQYADKSQQVRLCADKRRRFCISDIYRILFLCRPKCLETALKNIQRPAGRSTSHSFSIHRTVNGPKSLQWTLSRSAFGPTMPAPCLPVSHRARQWPPGPRVQRPQRCTTASFFSCILARQA